MLRLGGTGHLAVTPDGPRAPPAGQPGSLPRRRHRPADRADGLRLPPGLAPAQLDGFVLPCPGSDVVLVTTEPIHVPPDVRKEQLETYRLRVEDALHRADEAAERMVGNADRRKEDAPARKAA